MAKNARYNFSAFPGSFERRRRLAKNYVVPRRGLEPPRLAALVPETSASTNSATWAFAGEGNALRR